MLSVSTYFDLRHFNHAELFAAEDTVWQALAVLKSYFRQEKSPALPAGVEANGVPLPHPLVLWEGEAINGLDCAIEYGDPAKGALAVHRRGQRLQGASVIMAGVALLGADIRLGPNVLIESGAFIKEPLIVDAGSVIRQAAYLRGYCLVGKRCVVGHATEVKHSILLDEAKAGHFAYLGDSILGGQVNLGAGTKCANLRFLPGNVLIKTTAGLIDSGLKKFGAILGDRTQTGCNSVTSPGALLGPDSLLMPNATAASGTHPQQSVLR